MTNTTSVTGDLGIVDSTNSTHPGVGPDDQTAAVVSFYIALSIGAFAVWWHISQKSTDYASESAADRLEDSNRYWWGNHPGHLFIVSACVGFGFLPARPTSPFFPLATALAISLCVTAGYFTHFHLYVAGVASANDGRLFRRINEALGLDRAASDEDDLDQKTRESLKSLLPHRDTPTRRSVFVLRSIVLLTTLYAIMVLLPAVFSVGKTDRSHAAAIAIIAPLLLAAHFLLAHGFLNRDERTYVDRILRRRPLISTSDITLLTSASFLIVLCSAATVSPSPTSSEELWTALAQSGVVALISAWAFYRHVRYRHRLALSSGNIEHIAKVVLDLRRDIAPPPPESSQDGTWWKRLWRTRS
ncbi:hypothetical protein [Falsarthrobacter nasiphocae]|uniref:Uncharacterized protein n=1 Tax=Falsarthrobacter nasiphocae TaxID=189863 RepID=A0AAE3YFN4_9MICC|nr:hypothetical protein [Falsarthrobacter nasiphocae]MDR6892953.1 hypothetical protein [Falsarthrobacter nasiphocae]